MNKRKIEVVICVLALFGLLSYTFVHTGALLARWVNPWGWGYAAALGIELSVVLMSLRIGAMRKLGKRAGWLVFVLAVTLIVSAVANVVEGFFAFTGQQLTVNTLDQLDYIQGVVGVFATAFICLVVFALSEVIGIDIDYLAKQTKRDEQASEHTLPPVQTTANEPVSPPVSYKEAVYGLLDRGVQPSPTMIAEKVGTSKATAHKWIGFWEAERAATAPNGHAPARSRQSHP